MQPSSVRMEGRGLQNIQAVVLTELWHTQFMNICNPIQGFMQILLTQARNMSLSSFQA